MPVEPTKYFSRVRRYILSDGERFVTVVNDAGIPTYYPTALALARRARGVSPETLVTLAEDLVHLGLWAQYEGIDVNQRLEAGSYLDPSEVEALANACGLTKRALRRLISPEVSEIRRSAAFTKADLVINSLKSRRLVTAIAYFDLVGVTAEARLAKRSPELAERTANRMAMLDLVRAYRPRIQSSRVRGIINAGALARVAAFIATGNPLDVWHNEPIARRNWAIVALLAATGIRQGELRQLKPEDIDLGACELRIERRHDDPEDPRLREPNAKTYDRIIPLDPSIAELLETYLFGAGSDAAERRGSTFVFLSHDNCTFGTPLSDRTIQNVVKDLGDHLRVSGLTPHHLRHGWIQNLAQWAISSGISAADFERFANHLGGWSYVSKMAAEYRGDQLVDEAYKAGLKLQEARS